MSRGWDCWSRVYPGCEYALLGRSLARARQLALAALPETGRVLLLGDGDGRFLAAALAATPEVRFVSVDRSAGMLARSRRRVGTQAAERVEWHQRILPGDADRLPPGPFDAVVSQFFLDCFTGEELTQWWPAVAARVRPGGTWTVTDFAPPETLTGWARRRQALLLGLLYAAFRGTTPIRVRRLPEMRRPFREAGWSECSRGFSKERIYAHVIWRKPCAAPGRDADWRA